MPGKKNILLVNPWIYDFTAYDFWVRPLGLLQIAAVLESHPRFRLHFIDCLDRYHPGLPKKLKIKRDGRGPFFKQEVTKPEILKSIPRKYSRYGLPVALFDQELEKIPHPDVVLLTCVMSYWYPGVQAAVERIRKKFGRVPIILGGIYATLVPDHARRESGVDIICQGRGETQILSLLRDILYDVPFPDPELDSLEKLPCPSYHLLRCQDTLALLTSRGCPYRCTYCAGHLLSPGFEQMPAGAAVERIETLVRNFGTRNFAFYDDALFIHKKNHIIPLLKEIIRRNLPAAFHTPNGVHIQEIDSELAVLLKRADFQTLFLSQESFDEGWLDRTGPKLSGRELEHALTLLKSAGYQPDTLNVYLLAGEPHQDYDSIRESLEHVRRLGARPRLAFYSPIPGTRDWQSLVDRGLFSSASDPLLHNKITFPYTWGKIGPDQFDSLNRILREENSGSSLKGSSQ